MKTMVSSTSLLASDRSIRPVPPSAAIELGRIHPPIAESGIVADAIELVVDLPELLADPLDEGADVHAKAFLAIAGDEILAADQVVDLAIGDVGVDRAGKQPHDVELGESEVDALAVVERPADVGAQLQLAADQRLADVGDAVGDGGLLGALGDQP